MAVNPDIGLRSAARADLPALYKLAQAAFSLDQFSPDVLAEKLFLHPRPGVLAWDTIVALNPASDEQIVGFMQTVVRAAAGKAWIGLFAVDAEYRRRKIATMLLDRALASWPDAIAETEVLAIPGNYFAPGLDPRYTEALCFLERRGFERFRDCANLRTDLRGPFGADQRPAGSRCYPAVVPESERLRAAGIEVRRAAVADAPLLDAFFDENFGDDWRCEAGQAFNIDPPGLHLALQAGRIVGFAAHSTQNREWGFFGPMGTTPDARGQGVGRVLLWLCLNDLYEAGHRTAVIPWVGPISFYQKWAGSRVERVFWRYRLARGVPRS